MFSLRNGLPASLLIALTSFAAGGALVYWLSLRDQPQASAVQSDSVDRLVSARLALEARDFQQAAMLAANIPADDALHPEALLIQGEAATRQERHLEALELYAKVPRDGSDADVRARLAAGEIQLRAGSWQDAYESFRYGLDQRPDADFARNRLAIVLDYSGRRTEAAELLFELLQRDAFSERHLVLLSDVGPVQEPPVEVRRTEPDANDALVNLVNGRMAIWRDDPKLAQRFLERALDLSPGMVEADVRLGESLFLRSDYSALETWHRSIGADADWHPALWLLRARWAEAIGDARAACRCYWETLRRDPNHQVACYRLARLLPEVDPSVDAGGFLRRAVQLEEMSRLALVLHNNAHHVESMREAARLCEELGRLWEAAGWARAALVVSPQEEWAAETLARITPKLASIVNRQDPQLDPAAIVNLSSFPIPDLKSQRRSPVIAAASPAPSGPRFEDVASEVGMHFTYFNSPDPTTDSGRMYEFTGGGVGAVDYDLDGWPDLYWVQGCPWPPQAGQSTHLDRLCRNCRGTSEDVTAAARLQEDRFGQGVTVGDFDQDGLPDLYVANILQNRLWHNLGDGTFEDVTTSAGLTDSRWTASCLLADLNGDALPDLVDVNYAQGDDVYDRICEEGGLYRSCSPLIFQGANDRAYLNLGDGRFQDVSAQAGFEIGDGRGLGIVAFRPTDQHRQLNLFIANDMTANFYFSNLTPTRGGDIDLREQAVLAGLAFDVNGTAQACMGIAAADVDGNGLLDFAVTNFYSEANNLYLQSPGELFSDEAVAGGLRDPSYHMLGFGAQFLDADWDGWADLLVANGHVDDYTHLNIPYRMRPQFFMNRKEGRFVEASAGQLGPYFERQLLGRGLARLDWNGDRNDDAAISHLDDPVALIINRSDTPHHAFSLKLCGRTVDRDAIGTIVQVRAGDRQWTQQLTAGDGYESSNERRLVFGLGPETLVSELRIHWPDGTFDDYHDIAADSDYTAVQGSLLLTITRD